MTYRTKIQDGQIVVPGRIRRLAGLAEGDPVDVAVEQGKLVMVARVRSSRTVAASRKIQKQQREEFVQKLRNTAPESLKRMWADSKRNGTDKMTTREINAIISEVRAEQPAKQKIKNPPNDPSRPRLRYHRFCAAQILGGGIDRLASRPASLD
jgi:AbrB family looped-hinge helix DNA binding protein